MRRAGHAAAIGEISVRPIHKYMIGKPERKKPAGKPRCTCEDNRLLKKQCVNDWAAFN